MKKLIVFSLFVLSLLFVMGCGEPDNNEINVQVEVQPQSDSAAETDSDSDVDIVSDTENDDEVDLTVSDPNPEDPIEMPELATEDEIIAAFADKYPDWDMDKIQLTIQNNSEYVAGGTVGFEDQQGGGYWYAANTIEGWIIVADGNGSIMCADIEPFDFPSDWIAECWDEENQELVIR